MLFNQTMFTLVVLLASHAVAQLPKQDAELLPNYSQWKLAAGNGQLAEPVSIQAKPGFEVEMVRAAEKGEGSWISLAFDTRGRLLVGREDKGIWRMSFDAQGKVEKLEAIDNTLLEPRGLLVAYKSLYVTANNSKGLYRLRETEDGNYAPPELLQTLEGGVGHGRNGLALGPEGKIYIACGNNVKVPKDLDLTKSPYRNFGQDRLLPCEWNEFLFDGDVTPPCGFVARCDADGKNWQLVAGGFRNPYDLAFNRDGELFTYDADMEWDVGAPWYRPTTVMHVVPGGEYGWRQGTNVWPDHFADALPRVVDVGLGSPTGVAFGEKSKFPAPYRHALFILDWAYGRILAVHLTPQGASYSGKVETFLQGKPLNVTDVVFGPEGAMYFTVGGRGTRAAIYRVRWSGEEEKVVPTIKNEESRSLRAQRRNLEPWLEESHAVPSVKIEEGFSSNDPFVRFTARIAMENQGGEYYQLPSRISGFNFAWARGLLLLKNVSSNESALIEFDREMRLGAGSSFKANAQSLRGLQLSLIRHGMYSRTRFPELQFKIENLFPSKNWPENQLLTELLVYLQSPRAISGALYLIPRAENDQQRLFYIHALRLMKTGWSLEQRREYLTWLKAAEKFPGSHYMPRFITYIRTDALATFTDEERKQLAKEIDELGHVEAIAVPPLRPELSKWTLDELHTAVSENKRPPDLNRGEKLYAEAQCVRCHRHGDQGIPFGPDLHHVASRFGIREILEATVNPSKSIDDKYRTLTLETNNGLTATGFLVGGNKETYYIAADPLRPTSFQSIPRGEISSRKQSSLSPMPEGLLNGLTTEEVVDLLGYLGVIQAP